MSHRAPLPWTPALLVVLLGLWGAATVVVAFSASRLYSLPMVGVTLLPFVLVVSRNPRLFFLVGMLFSAVLGLSINFSRRVHMGGAASFSIDLVDLFMLPLVVFLVRDLAMGWRRELRFGRVSPWWLGAIVLGLVSVGLGPYREFAAFEVLRMAKVWLLFVIILNECVRVGHFKAAVWALVAGVVLNLGVSLAQFALKRTLGLEALGEPSAEALAGANYGVFLSAGSVFRVSGLLGHPNLMGAYLGLTLPLVLAMMFTDWRAWAKVLLAVVFLTGVGVLVLTLSRAAWVDFAVAVTVLGLVLAFHPELRARHLALKTAVLAAFVVGGIIAAAPVLSRLTGSDSGATDFRWQWVGIAWDMVQDRPVLGFGLNGFAYHAIDYSPYSVGKMVEMYGNILPAVHNVYMLVWAEQGTVGLLLYLGLQVHVLWLAVGNARLRLDDTVHMVSIGCACGMLAVMVDGLASFYQRVPAPARVWWILMALVVAAHHWNRANLPLRRPAAAAAAPR